ncbi:MAG: TetR/AcrR family transcriptional regulator [Burkholderiaceae bacterium]|nr:TetR/AcrR family transcriptional regulator [Burkholderiaceae bacterium]
MPLKRLFDTQVKTTRAKRERRKEARPGELLQAALDLFVEKGFAATRSEEVAARAGVSKGTLFLYFPSKEELFKAVVRENISGRFSQWNDEFVQFSGTTADMLHTCMDIWWTRVGATQASGISKLMLGEACNFPELAAFYRQEVVQPGHALLARIVQRGIDSGEFRAVDASQTAFSVVASMVFVMMQRHTGGVCVPADTSFDPIAFLHHQVDLMVRGLQTHAPEAS